MTRAWIDMGSNLDRDASIARGLQLLAKSVTVLRTSSVYESPAYGPPGQPDFYNLCIEIETDLTADALRQILRSIEAAAGRVRTANKFEPRVLDLDLILYPGEPPHPQLTTQRFVLEPLCELLPDYLLDDRPLSDHLATLVTR